MNYILTGNRKLNESKVLIIVLDKNFEQSQKKSLPGKTGKSKRNTFQSGFTCDKETEKLRFLSTTSFTRASKRPQCFHKPILEIFGIKAILDHSPRR